MATDLAKWSKLCQPVARLLGITSGFVVVELGHVVLEAAGFQPDGTILSAYQVG